VLNNNEVLTTKHPAPPTEFPVVQIKFFRTDPRVVLPAYESEGASGMDVRASIKSDILIPPLGRVKIPTGIKIEIPEGFEAQVRPRSGLAYKTGLTVLNSPGTIDSDYRGEIEVILVNLGESGVIIKNGERIAQLIIAPVCRAQVTESDTLSPSKRGGGGFGSTGVN